MPQSAQAREIVGFAGNYSSGTIVVKTNERALYYVLGNGKALRYPVGVGRAGMVMPPAWAVNPRRSQRLCRVECRLVLPRAGSAPRRHR